MKIILCLLIIVFVSQSCSTKADREAHKKRISRTYAGRVLGKSMTNSFFGDQCVIAVKTDLDTVFLETYTPSYIGYRVNALVNKGDSVQIVTTRRNLFALEDMNIIKPAL